MTDGAEPRDEQEREPEDDVLNRLMQNLDDIPHMPEPDDDLDERMRKLESKATEVKQRREAGQKEVERKLRSDREANKGLGVGLMVAYALLGFPLVGALVGYFLDRGSDHRTWTSLLVVLGAVGGIVFTVYVLNKSNKGT